VRTQTIYGALAAVAFAAILVVPPPSCAAAPEAAHAARPIPPPDARVDINHASLAALVGLPGMTPVWARRIVRFRPYHAKNDLLNRGVLPSSVYDRIKNDIIAHRNKE
jgi:DNA uptake protein ComE-like DNA-binding protein